MGRGTTGLRRSPAWLLFVVVACTPIGQGAVSSPASTALVPGELVLLQGPGPAALQAIEAADGTNVGTFTGNLVARLDSGGDLGEGYLVTASLQRLHPGRPITLEPLDSVALTGSAVIVPASNLTSFVGNKTVLVAVTADGGLAGYQHGSLLWSDPPLDGGIPVTLVSTGTRAAIVDAGGVRVVVPETGRLLAVPSPCPGVPVGESGSGLVFYCTDGGPHVALPDAAHGMQVAGPVRLFRAVRRDDIYMASGKAFYWLHPNGTAWSAVAAGAGGASTLEPDGSAFLALSSTGDALIEVVVGSAVTRAIRVPGRGYIDVATSRDGTFAYLLRADGLDIIHVPDGRVAASYAVRATSIALVSGG